MLIALMDQLDLIQVVAAGSRGQYLAREIYPGFISG
jgi:hypothetical protein